jgi:hypothetical protein
MSQNVIRLAVALPEEATKDIDLFSSKQKEGSVKWRIQPPDTEHHKPLGFEPVSGLALLWIALQITGEAALKITIDLLIDHIVSHWKERVKSGRPTELVLRAPNGATLQLPSQGPIDAKALEAWIKENASQ